MAPERVAALGIVGNCQAELLGKALQAVAGRTLGPIFYHAFDAAPTAERITELSRCRTLLVQGIKQADDYLQKIGGASPYRRIDFPCLRFASCWPYDDFNGWRDSVARSMDPPDPDRYYDGALARLRRSGLGPAERLSAYRQLKIDGLAEPRRIYDFETRRLEAEDKRFGCTIGADILAEFRTERLFYAVNRPAARLMRRLTDYVFAALEVRAERPDDVFDFDQLRTIQVPVHPGVAEELRLSWAEEATLYDIRDGLRQTWATYMADYIARYS